MPKPRSANAPRTLLEDVEDFLVLHPELKPASLGREAVADKDLVFDLRRGRSPRETTVAKVRAWMAGYAADRQRDSAKQEAARQRLKRSLPEVGGAPGGG